MKFGLIQLKAQTPHIMRALGSALAASATIVATKDVIYGNINGALAAAIIGGAGKFLTECFGQPTTVTGTVNGVPVEVTQPAPPPETPELIISTPDVPA